MAAAEAAALALISWEDLRLMSGMQLLMLLLIKSLVVEVGGEFKAFNSFLWLINDFVLTRYSESETREKNHCYSHKNCTSRAIYRLFEH